jgi:uncharacterized protein YecE (DUF72 family)
MPIHQALRVCPQLIVLDGRHDVYRCFTEATWEICRRYAPALETFLDEAFADFSGTEEIYPDLLGLGGRIQKEILEEVGLPVTIGIAKNRMVSKPAAKTVKPRGRGSEGRRRSCCRCRSKDRRHGAKPRALPRHEHPHRARFGIRFGRSRRCSEGQRLAPRAGPQRASRPIPARNSEVGLSPSVARNAPPTGRLGGPLLLVDRVIRAIRKLGLRTRTMRIRIRYSDGEDNETSISFPPTAFDEEIQPLARTLLWKLYARRVTIRFVGSGFSNFQADEGQLELFTDASLTRFHSAVDAIRDKFGHGAIVAGRAIELLGKLPHTPRVCAQDAIPKVRTGDHQMWNPKNQQYPSPKAPSARPRGGPAPFRPPNPLRGMVLLRLPGMLTRPEGGALPTLSAGYWMHLSQVFIGPAGWSYKDWEGKVYPHPSSPGFDPLAYLAQSFPCIEVNSSFYRPPSARMSEAWAKRTPDSFVFTVKAWERFTHDRETFTEGDARLFQEGIAPLLGAGKLGAILLQFPWFFRDDDKARDRIRRAADALRGWAPLVIELRHVSWLEALGFLRDQELNFCNIDQPQSSTAITGTRLVTGPVGYVRLHGRNAKAWFSKQAGRDEKTTISTAASSCVSGRRRSGRWRPRSSS